MRDRVLASARLRQAAATVVVMALGAWVLLLTAWVCDDAYIGFRVVDNLINGYGLRWNVDERVQAFSNPMWVLLLAPAYAITHEIYYTSLAMSALASLATLWVLLRRCSDSLMAGLLVTVALVLSPAFVEFSTSGLENALTHLLVVMFCASYFADDTAPARKAFALALLAALAAFNRLDSALLLGVPLAVFVIRHRSRAVFRALLLGALPLVAWEMFSLVYYGALVPNTAFAKLATGIPSRELIAQGTTYFRVSAAFDPVGAGLLVLAVVAAPIVDRRLLPVALGIATQSAYVLLVGGDFMAGRFFSAPVVASAAVVVRALSQLAPDTRRAAVLALGAALIAGGTATASATVASSRSYTPEGLQIPAHGIVDERMYYYWATGLMSRARTDPIAHPFATQGIALRASRARVHVGAVMGFLGYFAGPAVHIVDVYALCDPLLARLPAIRPWRIGHFEREVPAGYRESLESGMNQIVDADLARRYDLVARVTRDPLFSLPRLAAVVSLNVDDARRLAGF